LCPSKRQVTISAIPSKIINISVERTALQSHTGDAVDIYEKNSAAEKLLLCAATAQTLIAAIRIKTTSQTAFLLFLGAPPSCLFCCSLFIRSPIAFVS
jgi:hypothetical protein